MAKKPSGGGDKIHRSAVTGRYVTEKKAAAKPREHVAESRGKPKPPTPSSKSKSKR